MNRCKTYTCALLIYVLFYTLHASVAAAVSAASGVFNVQSYGATADGYTNDAAAIQAAIDAAGTSGGGIVYLPCSGTNSYYIGSRTLVVSSQGVTLQGCHGESDDQTGTFMGTTISGSGEGTDMIWLQKGGDTLKDLRVVESAASASDVGVLISPPGKYAIGNWSLEDVQIVGGPTAAGDAGIGIDLVGALKGTLRDVTSINWGIGIQFNVSNDGVQSNADPMFGCKFRQNRIGIEAPLSSSAEIMSFGSTIEGNMVGYDDEGGAFLDSFGDHFEDTITPTISVCAGQYTPSAPTDVVLCGAGNQQFHGTNFYAANAMYAQPGFAGNVYVVTAAPNGKWSWNGSGRLYFVDPPFTPNVSGTGRVFVSANRRLHVREHHRR